MPPVAMMPQRRVKGAIVVEVVKRKSEEERQTRCPLAWSKVSSSTVARRHGWGMSYRGRDVGPAFLPSAYQALDHRRRPRHVMF